MCLREPQDPVGLPCHHIYCLTCITESLDIGKMFCPMCRQELPNDFQPHVSEDIRWDFFLIFNVPLNTCQNSKMKLSLVRISYRLSQRVSWLNLTTFWNVQINTDKMSLLIFMCLWFLWLCSVSIKKNAEFRQRCNGFFVDLLSTVCFKDNTPPASGVIKHLLSFLSIETGTPYCRDSSSKKTNSKVLFPTVC